MQYGKDYDHVHYRKVVLKMLKLALAYILQIIRVCSWDFKSSKDSQVSSKDA